MVPFASEAFGAKLKRLLSTTKTSNAKSKTSIFNPSDGLTNHSLPRPGIQEFQRLLDARFREHDGREMPT
jgi:hypothetical protein